MKRVKVKAVEVFVSGGGLEGNILDFLLRALRRCALQQNGFGVERSMLLTLRFQECLSAC